MRFELGTIQLQAKASLKTKISDDFSNRRTFGPFTILCLATYGHTHHSMAMPDSDGQVNPILGHYLIISHGRLSLPQSASAAHIPRPGFCQLQNHSFHRLLFITTTELSVRHKTGLHGC
jgi:hypothetical protein